MSFLLLHEVLSAPWGHGLSQRYVENFGWADFKVIVESLVSERTDVGKLLVGLAENQPWALRAAYEEHAPTVRRVANRLLADSSAAEDIVHDVFVALPFAAKRFRQNAKLSTFLCAMAVKMAGQAAKKKQKRAQLSLDSAAEVQSVDDPHEEAERQQLARLLAEALATLPYDQRSVFVLCEVEGLSSVEVAEIVGAADGTVRARLMHAKRKLRENLRARGVS